MYCVYIFNIVKHNGMSSVKVTPLSRVRCEKLTGSKRMEFPVFYGTCRIIT
jgi:hypothetical protein